MELWIRTADEEKLLIAKDVRIEKHFRNRIVETDLGQEVDMRNGEYIFYLLANKGTKIGEYKTKERALEVLDEIQNIIIGKYMTNLNFEASFSKFDDEEARKTLIAMGVYEMPKE